MAEQIGLKHVKILGHIVQLTESHLAVWDLNTLANTLAGLTINNEEDKKYEDME